MPQVPRLAGHAHRSDLLDRPRTAETSREPCELPFPSVHPALLRALEERGYAEPTTVQTAVLEPEALVG